MHAATTREPTPVRRPPGASRRMADALAAAALTGAVTASVPAAAAAWPAHAPSLRPANRPPQENVPELEVGGPE